MNHTSRFRAEDLRVRVKGERQGVSRMKSRVIGMRVSRKRGGQMTMDGMTRLLWTVMLGDHIEGEGEIGEPDG
jgi:hypothetical protein